MEICDAVRQASVEGDAGWLRAWGESAQFQPDLLACCDAASGWSPLHYAARCCADERTIQALAGLGADVDAQGCNGETPLHVAVEVGSLVAVTTLLRLGASAAVRNALGRSPLELAEDEAVRCGTQSDASHILVLLYEHEARDSEGQQQQQQQQQQPQPQEQQQRHHQQQQRQQPPPPQLPAPPLPLPPPPPSQQAAAAATAAAAAAAATAPPPPPAKPDEERTRRLSREVAALAASVDVQRRESVESFALLRQQQQQHSDTASTAAARQRQRSASDSAGDALHATRRALDEMRACVVDGLAEGHRLAAAHAQEVRAVRQECEELRRSMQQLQDLVAEKLGVGGGGGSGGVAPRLTPRLPVKERDELEEALHKLKQERGRSKTPPQQAPPPPPPAALPTPEPLPGTSAATATPRSPDDGTHDEAAGRLAHHTHNLSLSGVEVGHTAARQAAAAAAAATGSRDEEQQPTSMQPPEPRPLQPPRAAVPDRSPSPPPPPPEVPPLEVLPPPPPPPPLPPPPPPLPLPPPPSQQQQQQQPLLPPPPLQPHVVPPHPQQPSAEGGPEGANGSGRTPAAHPPLPPPSSSQLLSPPCLSARSSCNSDYTASVASDACTYPGSLGTGVEPVLSPAYPVDDTVDDDDGDAGAVAPPPAAAAAAAAAAPAQPVADATPGVWTLEARITARQRELDSLEGSTEAAAEQRELERRAREKEALLEAMERAEAASARDLAQHVRRAESRERRHETMMTIRGERVTKMAELKSASVLRSDSEQREEVKRTFSKDRTRLEQKYGANRRLEGTADQKAALLIDEMNKEIEEAEQKELQHARPGNPTRPPPAQAEGAAAAAATSSSSSSSAAVLDAPSPLKAPSGGSSPLVHHSAASSPAPPGKVFLTRKERRQLGIELPSITTASRTVQQVSG